MTCKKFGCARPDRFTIQNLAALLAAERETARPMTLLVGGVAGVSLAVGGVGVAPVMLISLGARTRAEGWSASSCGRRASSGTPVRRPVQAKADRNRLVKTGDITGVGPA